MKEKFRYILILAFMLSFPVRSDAALSLSVTPVQGGTSLRIGRLVDGQEVNKEVRIRITSSDGKQYQVFQRLSNPLTNERGQALNRDAIKSYSIVGSNSAGSLYLQNIENLSAGDQLLYSSNPAGTGDTFTVVYSFLADRIGASGDFFGKIQYTLRAVGASGHDDVFLNVFLEASGNLKFEVEGSTFKGAVHLDTQSEKNRSGFVRLSFDGNNAQGIKIYQEVEIFPQNELFRELREAALVFVATGNVRGILHQNERSALTRKRTLLYSSNAEEDNFDVQFALEESLLNELKAGNYKGRVRYIVDTDSGQEIYPINLEINIHPIFNLTIDLPPGGVSFTRLFPSSPSQEKEVLVHVFSNLGKPYMVMQSLASALTNEKGVVIKNDYFTMREDLIEGEMGKVAHSDYHAVKDGDSTIFYSDRQGSPASFKVRYRLRSYPEISPGDYTTSIVYSLGEM